MGWTNPRTFVTGEVETAAIFNAHLRDNLNFLKSGVALSNEITSSSAAVSAETVLATQAFTADGSTLVAIEFTFNNLLKTVGTDNFLITLFDGATAGSGTQLSAWASGNASGTTSPGGYVRKVLTPSAGAHTYTARIIRNAGTGTGQVFAASTSPMNLTVGQVN
jgi:hypothetical protein